MTEPFDLVHWDTQDLLSLWADVEAAEARAREQRLRIEAELQQRMEQDGARVVYHPDLLCEIRMPPPAYDTNKLAGLKELVAPEVLARGYTPEHTEVVTIREHWDARVFKSWGRYGTEISKAINDAVLPSRGKVSIKRKEPKT